MNSRRMTLSQQWQERVVSENMPAEVARVSAPRRRSPNILIETETGAVAPAKRLTTGVFIFGLWVVKHIFIFEFERNDVLRYCVC